VRKKEETSTGCSGNQDFFLSLSESNPKVFSSIPLFFKRVFPLRKPTNSVSSNFSGAKFFLSGNKLTLYSRIGGLSEIFQVLGHSQILKLSGLSEIFEVWQNLKVFLCWLDFDGEMGEQHPV
jgi:hypothetical protein